MQKRNISCEQTIYFSDHQSYIKGYLEKCKIKIKKMLESLIENKTPLILWGIGASTAILLESFSQCKVIQLVDKNVMKQGLRYRIGENEFVIVSPNEINNKEATIFIMSMPYRAAIRKQIIKMGLENPVISFEN